MTDPPRDYVDVAAAVTRYERSDLLRLAFDRDPGLRVADVALSVQRLDRLPDDSFADYQLTPADVQAIRHAFADWPREASQDLVGIEAHGACAPAVGATAEPLVIGRSGRATLA